MLALPTAVKSADLSLKGFGAFLKAKLAFVAVFMLVFLIVALPMAQSFASTAISIDTDTLFQSVNDWINVFLPIAAIGLGIAIALAVISYVGDAVLHGFSRSRR